MKKNLLYIMFITSIILLIGLIISVKSNYQVYNSLKNSEQKLSENEIKLNTVLWVINQHYKYAGQEIHNFDIISNKQKLPFNNLLNDKYDIFYKFSLRDCSTCIDTELRNITENANYIKILIETSNPRDFKTFLTTNHIDTTKAFRIEKPILEEAELPFYFATNVQLCVKDIFSPIKELPELTIKFYQIMTDKYLKQ